MSPRAGVAQDESPHPMTDARADSLMACLSRARLDPSAAGTAADGVGRISSEFVDRCLQQGVASLVYHNIRQLGLDGRLPEQAHNRLREARYRTLADNLQLTGDLREVAGRVESLGMPLLVLKGPALIHLVYKDPALRPMTDIDLLVHPEDSGRLGATLKAIGFVPSNLYPNLFQRGRTVLDIHTDPINRARIKGRGRAIRLEVDALWRRSVPLGDLHPLRMLCVEDQILTLSIHALKHGYQQTIWLVDIAGCLDAVETAAQWERVVGRFRSAGVLSLLALTLRMLEGRLGRTPSPVERQVMTSTRLPSLGPRLIRAATRPGMPQILEPILLVQAVDGRRGKIEYLLEAAFPRRDVLRQATGLRGDRSGWLAYPYRMVQLSVMALRYIWHLSLAR